MYSFTVLRDDFDAYQGAKFAYGSEAVDGAMFLKSCSLLFDHEINSQEINAFDYNGIKALFPVFHKNTALPFDIFSAAFFLVSRYEEYLPHVRDNHERFEAASSCLFRLGLLQKPVVNIWCQWFGEMLEASFSGLKIKKSKYAFTPTYDIDLAWAYLHKGLYRSAGGYLRDMLDGNKAEIRMRTDVLRRKLNDPFDTYKLQLELQKRFGLKPIYFILFAAYDQYDKNISIKNPSFQKLIKQLSDYAEVGIHPSYASLHQVSKLRNEISTLSNVLNFEITKSRQHFLRMNLPTTYRHLIDLGITDDYTMGYATQAGFRAGIANSFNFYDLDYDVATTLTIHPTILMDGTMRDYLQLSPDAAIKLATQLINEVKAVNGTFISLWHNESLSNQNRWANWLEVYNQILIQASP